MKKSIVIVLCICVVFIFVYVIFSRNDSVYEKSLNESDTVEYRDTNVINVSRWNTFIDHIKNSKKDRVNLIWHTDEDDIIITQFFFNGKDIEIYTDRSKDRKKEQGEKDIKYEIIRESSELLKELENYLQSHGFHLGVS